ncbi:MULTISPECIES: GNAT family N-acetyltransferase [unclassified Colwellia]|jgi:GNAT superfamily N-acetyltransferase|uniref:GNAT family N-acetyltransferase n=1 Tax=unclassified Colwellia TaxID=196834 RepID=UPI000D3C5C14|nr:MULTISPECIES: GNAT family N-acetyltransferase [unclassified Colwellia]AWB58081.1 GNAT family N-acetyltransferase [Colwellia sp. Arc7-D]MBA6417491.1 GNAT family N-acetyltransferase [Colwellia sp. 6M3]|tara:strand:+ start:1427 stop:2077 length:651 start_codon:yes stop_codon:yes gene_type:complete
MSSDAIDSNQVDIKAAYLSAQDLKLAASLLYQAYHDDPVFLEIFSSDKSDYEQRLRAAIREELNAFWQAKQPMVGLYLGDNIVGVACLNNPEDGVSSERFWHWRLKMLLGAGYFSTKQMIEKEKIVLAAVPLKKFHMLSFIAIHPLHQHHGFGHYLMAAVNTILDEHKESEGVAVYATSKKYKAFFKNVNYQFIEEVEVGNVSGSLMVYYRETPES